MPRIKVFCVRFSPGEFALATRASEAAGMPLGSWLRTLAIRAADAGAAPADAFIAPPPEEPPARLTQPVATRLQESQAEALKDYARACGLPVSAYVRRTLLGAQPVPRRPLARSAIVAVNRVGNNLNQLVHLAHTGIILAPQLLRALAEVQMELRALLTALLDADQVEPPEAGP